MLKEELLSEIINRAELDEETVEMIDTLHQLEEEEEESRPVRYTHTCTHTNTHTLHQLDEGKEG